ncbi:lipopolysaccharide-induced tumor necrosis factor-alpha factor homolog [Amblyomma americanum]
MEKGARGAGSRGSVGAASSAAGGKDAARISCPCCLESRVYLFQGQYPFVYDNTVVREKPGENSQPGQCVITVYSQWGPLPVPVICPYCRQQIVTKIVHRPGFLTWMLCGSLAALGCILGCCLVPFCINSCQDIVHVCPHCSRTLGNFRMI